MPGPLDALERLMEEAVEGTVQRLFRPELQPVQLAKTATRRMEDQQVIGARGPEVPNSYTVSLNPADFERFARYQVSLQRAIAQYLESYARDHGWRPISAIRVVLASDSSVSQGRPRVEAQMVDVLQERPPLTADLEQPIERTARRPRVRVPSGVRARASGQAAVLVGERGEQFPLSRGIVTIGRALENDVVIPDTRVSRFHAEIILEDNRVVLRDLGSTNGTRVAERDVDRCELRDGEVVSLGGYRLTYRKG